MEIAQIQQIILENMSEPVYVRDLDKKILYVNPASEELTGWRLEEALGKKCYEIFGDELLTCKSVCPVDKAINEKLYVLHHEGNLKTGSGKCLRMKVSISPLYEGDAVFGAVIIMADITSLRQVQETNFKTVIALEQEIEKRKKFERRIKQLNELKEELLGFGTLHEKLQRITQAVVEIFDADFARIWIIRPGDLCEAGCIHAEVKEGPHVCQLRDRCLHLTASAGRYTHIDGKVHRRVPFGCYKIGRVAADVEPKFLTNDMTQDERVHDREWTKSLGLVAFAGYRLTSGAGRPIGVLALFKQSAVSPEEDALLEGVANTSAQVIQSTAAADALKESQRRYAELFNSAGDAIFVQDLSGRILDVNAVACDRLGYSRDELRDMTPMDIDSPEYAAKVPERIEELRKAGHCFFETEHVSKDGRVIPIELSSRIVEQYGQPVVLSIARDVTDRKKAEQALRESEESFRALSEATFEAIFLSEKGLCIGRNLAAEKMFGYCTEEAMGRSATEWISPEYRELVLNNMLAGHEGPYQAVALRKDGTVFPCEIQGKTINYQGRRIRVTALRDITERIRAEAALRESEKRFRKLMEHSPMAVAVANTSGRVEYVNKRFVEMFGYTLEDIPTLQHWLNLAYPKPGEADRVECDWLEAVRASKGTGVEPEPREREVTCKDGTTRVIDFRKTLIGDRIVHTLQDITERKRAQEMQLQAARYKAVADLAAGVAHNFNNLLQVVLGKASFTLLSLELGDYPQAKESTQHIVDSAGAGAQIVKRLQYFAGLRTIGKPGERERFDVSEIVEQAVEMTKPAWSTKREKLGGEIVFHLDLERGCWVEGTKDEIFEVIINIIYNAAEAMPEGGTISIRSQAQRDLISLSITDTGPGIPKQMLDRLFNPFATTSAEFGRGLGLATCRETVVRNGGRILAESAQGRGTTVTVELPRSEEGIAALETPKTAVSDLRLNILVIDDMEPMLNLMSDWLKELRQNVMTALSGQEGIRIFQSKPVDAVICDLGMPGMSGWEVGEFIKTACRREKRPKPPFVILTGWGDLAADQKRITESGVDAVIQKPIDVARLMGIVRKLVEKSQTVESNG